MGTKDTPQGIVGLKFARSLLSGDYEKAHSLLSAELKIEYPPLNLKQSFERMMSREHGEVRDIVAVLDNTDLGESWLDADGLAWVLIGVSGYVMITAKPFSSDFLITELIFMEQEKRLAALLKIRDDLRETLRSAISKGEVSPENRSKVLSSLASIQRQIESLNYGHFGADAADAQDWRFDTDDWSDST